MTSLPLGPDQLTGMQGLRELLEHRHIALESENNEDENYSSSKPSKEGATSSGKEVATDLRSHFSQKYKSDQTKNDLRWKYSVGYSVTNDTIQIRKSLSLPTLGSRRHGIQEGHIHLQSKTKQMKNDIGHKVFIKRRSESFESLHYDDIPSEEGVPTQLIGSIQLGIFAGVSHAGNHNPSPSKDRNVLLKDFEEIETISFPKRGSEITPPHNYRDFRFQSHAPFTFAYYRRQFYGIDASSFLASLCSRPMVEFGSSGKSGSLFKQNRG